MWVMCLYCPAWPVAAPGSWLVGHLGHGGRWQWRAPSAASCMRGVVGGSGMHSRHMQWHDPSQSGSPSRMEDEDGVGVGVGVVVVVVVVVVGDLVVAAEIAIAIAIVIVFVSSF